jgi:hypothetical protein
MIDGKPGLMVNKTGCPMLHKGLMGAWYHKRMQISGEVRFQDVPVKNDYSHPCDGCGYGFLGAGEFKRLGGTNRNPAPAMADGDFDVFG